MLTTVVSTRTYANIATADVYGGDATIALSAGRLTGFAGASAFQLSSPRANALKGPQRSNAVRQRAPLVVSACVARCINLRVPAQDTSR